MCDSPHENVAQGAKAHTPLPARGRTAWAADFFGGALGAPFSAVKPHCAPVRSLWCLCAATLCPKWGQRRPKVPKRCRKGHFWETFWSPFACNFAIVAPCQNLSICCVLTTLCGSGPGPFSFLNASWERSTPAEPSFRDFLRPWGRHGDRQGAAGHPKDVRKATRGHPETTKNQASGAPGVSGLSRAVPGVPPRTKNDPKTSKNRLLRRPAFVENSR